MRFTNIKTIINLQLLNSYLGLFLLVLFLTTISSCKKEDSDDVNDSTINIGTAGGSFRIGQLEIVFPENSVTEEIIIEGNIVELTVLPENVTPLSEVHKIDISNPGVYTPNSATLGIDHNDNNEITSLFVSSDGITWTDLRGFRHENKIKSQIPHFSYFFAGTAMYNITLQNDASDSENFFLYQYDANICNYNTRPVVMQNKYLQPSSSSSFNWVENFMFWFTTGQLIVGEIVNFETIKYADQTTHNLVTLTNQGGNYSFQSAVAGPTPGPLTIQTDATIPQFGLICGIGYADFYYGLSNMPTYAVEALPLANITFDITSNEYFVGLGYISAGQVIDPLAQPSISINFPSGSYNATVTLDAGQNLTVTY